MSEDLINEVKELRQELKEFKNAQMMTNMLVNRMLNDCLESKEDEKADS